MTELDSRIFTALDAIAHNTGRIADELGALLPMSGELTRIAEAIAEQTPIFADMSVSLEAIARNTAPAPAVTIWFQFGGARVQLSPNQGVHVMTQLHIDQLDTLSLLAFDAAGNQVAADYDGPVQWSNSNPAAVTATVSGDNSEVCVLDPQAVGEASTVNFSASIGGTVFTGSLEIEVVAGDVARVEIVETISPKAAAQSRAGAKQGR
jgi:ABC-type uncharacterized transport system permease subunit